MIDKMKMINLGLTKLKLPVSSYLFTYQNDQDSTFAAEFGHFLESHPRVLILGGVHGDEPEGVVAARGLIYEFQKSYQFHLNTLVVPEVNPEGVLLKTRGNSNKVDLNRNLPTQDWSPIAATERYNPGPSPLSEIENQILVNLIKEFSPHVIISLHSWKPMLNTNGDLPEAHVIAQKTGYVIEPDIGYPTPGSLGTYAGHELKIPTLTYEIERDIKFDQIIQIHVPAILAGLKISEKRAV